MLLMCKRTHSSTQEAVKKTNGNVWFIQKIQFQNNTRQSQRMTKYEHKQKNSAPRTSKLFMRRFN